jgi:hypothetical protein
LNEEFLAWHLPEVTEENEISEDLVMMVGIPAKF